MGEIQEEVGNEGNSYARDIGASLMRPRCKVQRGIEGVEGNVRTSFGTFIFCPGKCFKSFH